jgi:hypothetical protein
MTGQGTPPTRGGPPNESNTTSTNKVETGHCGNLEIPNKDKAPENQVMKGDNEDEWEDVDAEGSIFYRNMDSRNFKIPKSSNMLRRIGGRVLLKSNTKIPDAYNSLVEGFFKEHGRAPDKFEILEGIRACYLWKFEGDNYVIYELVIDAWRIAMTLRYIKGGERKTELGDESGQEGANLSCIFFLYSRSLRQTRKQRR